VCQAAFPTAAEADLVDALRLQASPIVSLVVEDTEQIIGQILFSPVTLPGYPQLKIMGLAPMAVLPSRQLQGIGTMLVTEGLLACEALGIGAVVVLGHPGYYPRFGFTPAASFDIGCQWEVPAEAFMALELEPGCLASASGQVEYHAAFGEL
jgi:putative acetyltransferase